MEDLIKRQEAIEVIHKFFREKVDYVCGERKEVPFDEIDHILECNKELSSAIKEIPTAFNVEAVVKEVQDIGTRFCTVSGCDDECECCDHGSIMKAIIEIVKGGGVNE